MKNSTYSGPKCTSNLYLSEQRDYETSVPSPQGSFQQIGGFGGDYHLYAREGLDLETAEFNQWYACELLDAPPESPIKYEVPSATGLQVESSFDTTLTSQVSDGSDNGSNNDYNVRGFV
jgi:hypothetical protein